MIWRIRDRADFSRLSQEGRRARAGALWCTYLLDPSAFPPRVAFALSRALGNAVARNKVRRRLRMLLTAASMPPGWYLFGATPAIVERQFDALATDVERLLTTVRSSMPPPTRGDPVAGGSCD